MRSQRKGLKLLALIAGLSMLAAACGSDDEGGSSTTEGGPPAGGAAGGDFIDIGTFVGDPPEHLDPALNSTLDAYQVINAMYDGLTDIDTSDPDNPEIVPHVAESFEANEDASVWTFKIREGQAFAGGEPIVPSTFKKSWERAAELAGDYSYLMTFLEGGEAALDPESDHTISGVVADAAAAAAALGTACASVEFITSDPSRSTAETGVVLEVNTTPGIAQHHLVDNDGATPHTAARVLDRLLSGPNRQP